VTTGKSSLETIAVLKEMGAEIVGIACIVNRSVQPLDYPLFEAIKLDIESWDAADCPLCKEGIPYVKPGSRTIK
jgi:orotate phosphoribosyltransferase